jgi:PPOX class probable FMN-dependent enzyme
MTPSVTQVLRDALDLEFPRSPRVATLATVDPHRRPRARNVLVRNITDDGILWIVSDGRSEKNQHLRTTPDAELVFWLPTSRQQFRLLCEAQVLGKDAGDPRRAQAWLNLTDATRALFVWPTPGKPRGDCDVEFVQAVSALTPTPDSFELLVFEPDELDHLDLNPHPHCRIRYRLENAWQPEELNP